ncbi:MAG: hypothetical protein O3C18_07135 [Bacteroidetes bacterium]|nr:hypothetical protein [Bacteroidota bacterium]MDA1242454.1 hypothetical protein [Bacteroidota bacterium]
MESSKEVSSASPWIRWASSIGIVCLVGLGCTQVPGDGGRASIQGHVEIEPRSVLTNPATAGAPYMAADEQVFVIYGDNIGPDDQVETNHEGAFVIPWLRPGHYTLYVYSEDTTGVNPPRDMAVIREVVVEGAREVVVLDTLRIYKRP